MANPRWIHAPDLFFVNDKDGKPVGINMVGSAVDHR